MQLTTTSIRYVNIPPYPINFLSFSLRLSPSLDFPFFLSNSLSFNFISPLFSASSFSLSFSLNDLSLLLASSLFSLRDQLSRSISKKGLIGLDASQIDFVSLSSISLSSLTSLSSDPTLFVLFISLFPSFFYLFLSLYIFSIVPEFFCFLSLRISLSLSLSISLLLSQSTLISLSPICSLLLFSILFFF